MHTRLFYGTIQTGKEQEALKHSTGRRPRDAARGCLLAQLYRAGTEVSCSSMGDKEDLAAYGRRGGTRALHPHHGRS